MRRQRNRDAAEEEIDKTTKEKKLKRDCKRVDREIEMQQRRK